MYRTLKRLPFPLLMAVAVVLALTGPASAMVPRDPSTGLIAPAVSSTVAVTATPQVATRAEADPPGVNPWQDTSCPRPDDFVNPGKLCLGVAAPEAAGQVESTTGNLAEHRIYGQNLSDELAQIRYDQANHRLAWTSFKPDALGVHGDDVSAWRLISHGAADAALRERARGYASLDSPILVTFHHEASNGHPDRDAADFAAAYAHVYDIMKDETGLRNVMMLPVFSAWLWNGQNDQHPQAWLRPELVSRLGPLVGLDLYQHENGPDIGATLDGISQSLTAAGHPNTRFAIGETGGTNLYREGGWDGKRQLPPNGDNATGAQFLQGLLQYAVTHPYQVRVVNVFNSPRNAGVGRDWTLSEPPVTTGPGKLDTQSKLDVFRHFLDQSVTM